MNREISENMLAIKGPFIGPFDDCYVQKSIFIHFFQRELREGISKGISLYFSFFQEMNLRGKDEKGNISQKT